MLALLAIEQHPAVKAEKPVLEVSRGKVERSGREVGDHGRKKQWKHGLPKTAPDWSHSHISFLP